MTQSSSTRLRLAAATGIFLCLAGIARADAPQPATVGQIQGSPLDFDEKTVVVVGTVEQASPAGNESAYNLRDGSAKITVVSRHAAPSNGDHLQVTGTVRVFGGAGEDADDPHDKFPPALFESARSPAP
jgi:hypothetical protein